MLKKWGGWRDSNPRSSGPQPDVLTTTLHPPYMFYITKKELFSRKYKHNKTLIIKIKTIIS